MIKVYLGLLSIVFLLAGCGGDSSSNPSEHYESVSSLGECDDDHQDDSVYVKSMDVYMTCQDGFWMEFTNSETAATPADPEFENMHFTYYGDFIGFDVKTVSTTGEGLLPEKLFYSNSNRLSMCPVLHQLLWIPKTRLALAICRITLTFIRILLQAAVLAYTLPRFPRFSRPTAFSVNAMIAMRVKFSLIPLEL